MFQKTLMGLCATCVLSAPQITGAANAGVVLHATESHNAAEPGSGTVDNVTVGAPSAPGSPTPEHAAIGTGQSLSLTWSADGATRYDVRFGVHNPPPAAATDLTSAEFVTPSLAQGTVYYWQVVARNAMGITSGPMWSFTTAALASGPSADFILSSASEPNPGGDRPPAEATAIPRAQTIVGVDRGRSNPVALPVRDFTVTSAPATAAMPQRAERATRAAATSKFKDAAAASKSKVPIVSAQSAAPVVTEVSKPIKPEGVPVAAIGAAFRTPSREGGVTIDQVVLSPGADLTIGPGYDTTTTPQTRAIPAATVAYSAITDRNVYTKPPLPFVGPAGFRFADPTFGSNMLRVTDGGTRPGMLNRSFRVPSNAHLSAWNSNSTAFYVISNDGTVIPYSFNAATMAASRMQAAGTGDGGLTLGFYVEPQFSLVNPNVIYGAVSGANNRTISQYDFQTGKYSPLVDLDTIAGGLAGTYVGGVMSGGTLAEKFITFFGGGGQDHHFYALWAPVGNIAGRKLLNTADSTINGTATTTLLNFRLHSAQIDRSGRFVFLYPTSVDMASPRYASQVYVWDTSTDTVTAITSGGRDGGHR